METNPYIFIPILCSKCEKPKYKKAIILVEVGINKGRKVPGWHVKCAHMDIRVWNNDKKHAELVFEKLRKDCQRQKK